MIEIYDKIVRHDLSIRRITIAFNDVIDLITARNKKEVKQLDLFSIEEPKEEINEQDLENEKNIQKAIINNQIGGHSAWMIIKI